MGSLVSEFLGKLKEPLVFFAVDENQLNKRIRLGENRPDCPLDFLGRSLHGDEDADDSVRARRAASEKAVAPGDSKPCFKENEQGRERGKPTHKKEGELKQRPHTSF